ncbi:hypothetical protein LCGC14_1365100 [marine sediment metagenome]|uniref:dATP/dGTP diphosphohydrolase N-terminal domain-containing protein n=1 Tax=marine sediment metagenome TaxID=412755 RepID=A0A0F9K7H7_9ZZZZ
MRVVKNCLLCKWRPIGEDSCGKYTFPTLEDHCPNYLFGAAKSLKEKGLCKKCSHRACSEDFVEKGVCHHYTPPSAEPNEHPCEGCHNLLLNKGRKRACGAAFEISRAGAKRCHTKHQLSDGTKNPKDGLGVRKSPTSGIPTIPKREVGLAMFEGALKYGRHNYRVTPVVGTVYIDSAERHIDAWIEGEDIDVVSGIHHLSKAAADLLLLRDAILMDAWVDDRPPHYPNPGEDLLSELNEKAAALIDRHPNVCEPYTEVAEAKKRETAKE